MNNTVTFPGEQQKDPATYIHVSFSPSSPPVQAATYL